MAQDVSCGNGISSSYCRCKDYYGFSVNQYKYFNISTNSYNCCNILTKYVSYTDSTSSTKIHDYIQSTQSGDNCNDFLSLYPKILNDEDLKKELPMLYWQGLMNASLFDTTKFKGVPSIDNDGKTITCANGDEVPVFLSYNDYESKLRQNRLLCTRSNFQDFKNIKFLDTDLDLPYSVRYVKSSGGGNCSTHVCTMENEGTFNNFNIGDEIYKNSGGIYIDRGTDYLLYIYIGIILLVVLLYIYYHVNKTKTFKNMTSNLNRMYKNLGSMVQEHSRQLRDSFHGV